MNENIIFDLTREDWKYKGVLFAELDINKCSEEINSTHQPFLKNYLVGIMAIIWTDENECWHCKIRFKFPKGNKQVGQASFKKELEEGIKINETYVLNYLYKMPMINKIWCKNSDGTPEGIVKIIEDLNMIESKKIVGKNE